MDVDYGWALKYSKLLPVKEAGDQHAPYGPLQKTYM